MHSIQQTIAHRGAGPTRSHMLWHPYSPSRLSVSNTPTYAQLRIAAASSSSSSWSSFTSLSINPLCNNRNSARIVFNHPCSIRVQHISTERVLHALHSVRICAAWPTFEGAAATKAEAAIRCEPRRLVGQPYITMKLDFFLSHGMNAN